MAREFKVWILYPVIKILMPKKKQGARLLLNQHDKLPLHLCYVRCVEEHEIPGEGTFRVVVCMLKEMSDLLLATKWPSIDTSFKRVHGWQEFEVEAWFPEFSRCKYSP